MRDNMSAIDNICGALSMKDVACVRVYNSKENSMKRLNRFDITRY